MILNGFSPGGVLPPEPRADQKGSKAPVTKKYTTAGMARSRLTPPSENIRSIIEGFPMTESSYLTLLVNLIHKSLNGNI